MRRNSLFAGLLAGVMILSACSTADKNQSNQGDANSDTTTTEGSVLKDGTMTELKMVFPASSAAPSSLSAIEEEMNQIMQETMDATIKLQLLEWGVFSDQANLMLSSGEDVSVLFSFTGAKTYANSGKIQPVTEYVSTYAPQISEDFADYITTCTIDGELYGFPTFHEYGRSGGLICRTDMLEEMNIDPNDIKTWDDVEAVLEQVVTDYPTMDPLCISEQNEGMLKYFSSGTFDELQTPLGISLRVGEDAEPVVVNMYETEEYRALAETAYDWNQKGYFMADATTATNTRAEILSAGNTFGYIGIIHPGTRTQEIRSTGMDISTISVTNVFGGTGQIDFAQYVLPTACKTPEKAVAFLELLYSNEDMQNLFHYGLEGVDYEYKDQDTKVIGYPEGVNESNVGWVNEPWITGNASISAVWETDPATIWEDYLDFNSSMNVSPAYGFTFDSSNSKNEVTAIENVVKKYRAVIESGYSDVDTALQKFNEELNAAGMAKLVEEAQRQFDEWYSAQ